MIIPGQHHALGGAQRKHDLTNLSRWRPLPHLYTQRSGELWIANWLRHRTKGELEGHRKHHEASQIGFEPRSPVSEAAFDGEKGLEVSCGPVESAHHRDQLTHLCAIRADVLDRRRTNQTWDARHGLEPAPAAFYRPAYQRIPWFACRNGDHCARTCCGVLVDAAG